MAEYRSTRAIGLYRVAISIETQIDNAVIKADGSGTQVKNFNELKNDAAITWEQYHRQVWIDTAEDDEGPLSAIGGMAAFLDGENGSISNGACNLMPLLALLVALVILVIGFDIPVDTSWLGRTFGF